GTRPRCARRLRQWARASLSGRKHRPRDLLPTAASLRRSRSTANDPRIEPCRATRGDRERPASQLGRGCRLLARVLSTLLQPRHSARRRRVRAARLHDVRARRVGPRRNRRDAGGPSSFGISNHGQMDADRQDIGRVSAPHVLGPMPREARMRTEDERLVRAPLAAIFALAADVLQWPRHLSHYRFVRFHERRSDGGGTVEMSANRPFGVLNWPTFWTSLMSVTPPGSALPPSIRFRHVQGVTSGMDVEWAF